MPLFMRYQFPREPGGPRVRMVNGLEWREMFSPDHYELQAREIADRFLALPAATRSVGQLENITAGLDVRVSTALGEPLPGAERLASWMYLVRAPGRVFLDVDVERMNDDA